MLRLDLPKIELYDQKTNSFYTTEAQQIELEHSLVAVSEWESKWHKAFLTKEPKTSEEMQDYVRCMTLTKDVDPIVYQYLPADASYKINKYIEDPMTATWFRKDEQQRPNRETVTAELIYYWMIQCEIPFECQHWHLNKLLTLIHVCDVKNTPAKKMGKGELMRRNSELNALRRSKYHTKG